VSARSFAASFVLPAAALAASLALPAAAIAIRADRDPEEYAELATRYVSAVALGTHGTGVLIAPRWILTADSVGRVLRPGEKLQMGTGRKSNLTPEVQSVALAPDGIALVLLRAPLDDVEPTPIYRTSDEKGKTVVIVGYGAVGVIGSEAMTRAGPRLAAINTVDRVETTTLGLAVKKPDDASDLQGAAAPGDAGAPAFIETRDGLFVAGIARGPGGAGIPKEGDVDLYARVSALAQWIDVAMFKAAAEEATAATKARP
jgi:hypothetical protein